jgi:hypothetical protein
LTQFQISYPSGYLQSMILVDGSEKRGCFDDLVISNAQNED